MRRSLFSKTEGDHATQSPIVNYSFVHDPPVCHMDVGNSEPEDSNGSEEDDDLWKPLNPHESGNLKIKPFKKGCLRTDLHSFPFNFCLKVNSFLIIIFNFLSLLALMSVKAFKQNYKKSGKHESLTALFPMEKLHGPVSQEFAHIWEEQNHESKAHKEFKSV